MDCPNDHGPTPAEPSPSSDDILAGLDMGRLPYPVALAARRLIDSLHASADPLRTLFRLKDCFEASIKYLAALLLIDYPRSGSANPRRDEELLQGLVRPTLGVWVNQIVAKLARWLLLEAGEPTRSVAALFACSKSGGHGGEDTALRQQCSDFVKFRNDYLGHGAERSNREYEEVLAKWLPVLRQLLEGVTNLARWRLGVVADVDRCQVWMGSEPPSGFMPGKFTKQQIGRVVLLAPSGQNNDARPVCELYPFLCYLPDPDQEKRLHYYDSVYCYKPKRREALVLEYDRGQRHPRPEPLDGLEEAFTLKLLEQVCEQHRGRMVVLEGRFASFGELIDEHADIVGRRFAVERVRRFLDDHDRGLLVIEAAPGQGKTALLAHLIEKVFDKVSPLPAHFFYRRTANITRPDVCIRSLFYSLLQIHDLTEAEESKRQDSPELVYQKIVKLLTKEIAPRLEPGRRQLIFLDALDEADDLNAAFGRIPEALPAGVYIIASTRPVSARAMLARRSHLEWFNLDDPDLLQQNLSDGKEYVQRELIGTNLSQATLDELARVGAGNFLVLKLLCRHARTTLAPQEVGAFLSRLATGAGEDQLAFLYREFWERITGRCSPVEVCLLCDVAGILVLAHAPLTEEVICGVLGLRAGQWDWTVRLLAEYLTAIEHEEDGVRLTSYRVYHESFADFLRSKVAVDKRRLQGRLADFGLSWQELPEGYGRTYALRFGPRHLLEAGRAGEAADLLLHDWRFLEAKAEAGLVHELAGDFRDTAAALPTREERRRLLELIGEGIWQDMYFISRHPTTLFQCLWNSCWWYDSSETAHHYDPPQGGWALEGAPWARPGRKLCFLLEAWRSAKESASPGFLWLRSLRPPALPLGAGQKAVFRRHVVHMPILPFLQVRDADYVHSVAFSPNGQQIVSGGEDGTVRVWDMTSGKQLHCLKTPAFEGAVTRAVFSPDGSRIAAVTGPYRARQTVLIRVLGSPPPETVRLWDAANGRPLPGLTIHQPGGQQFFGVKADRFPDHWATDVAFSPDGRQIVAGLPDGTVRVWDVASRDELVSLTSQQGDSTAATFRLRSCWDYDTLADRMGHQGGVTSVACSPDSLWIASGGADGTVRLWNAGDPRGLVSWLPTYLKGHEDIVTSVAFRPDGQWVGSASMDRTVRLWDLANGQQVRCLRDENYYPTSVAFSTDGRRMVVACKLYSSKIAEEAYVHVWDVVEGRRLTQLKIHEFGRVNSVAFSPDGHYIVSGGDDGTVRLWNAASTEQTACLPNPVNLLPALIAFSPDGSLFVTVSSMKTVQIWDAAHGRQLVRFESHCRVRSVTFSPDGQRIALSGDTDWSACLWDIANDRHIADLKEVGSLAFSPDSQRLVIGDLDGTVRVWDVARGHELVCFRVHSSEDSAAAEGAKLAGSFYILAHRKGRPVAFSPDGQRIVSVVDQIVRIWDVAGERQLACFNHQDCVDVAFSPDGRLLVLTTRDKTVKLWDVDRGMRVEPPQSSADIAPRVPEAPSLRWRILVRNHETVVEAAQTPREVAWFSSELRCLSVHPDGRTWAAMSGGDHLWLLTLEGDNKQP